MMMKMTMKTFKIGFQNPPIFYDTLHLFSHTLILFRTVLGGLCFKFSLQEFQTIYWIKFFISFRHFNFLLSLQSRLENVSSNNPRIISSRMPNCGDDILQIPDLLFSTSIDTTKFFNSLMTSLDTEEYMEQPRQFPYDFGGPPIFPTSNIMSRPATNVKSEQPTRCTFLSQFQPLRHSLQSLPRHHGAAEGRKLKRATARTVSQFIFEELICRYGAISEIVTDNGPEVKGATEELLRHHGIPQIHISPYNSQANGVVERGHFTIREGLVKACEGKINRWPDYVHHAFFANRVTVR